jgi:holo-[acyl-carrier protein] synthase
MDILGTGIDVVEVARISAAIDRHGETFLARLFTPAERAYCDGQAVPARHYAARFAAKEAVAKALGTGIGQHAAWLDLNITRSASGAPEVELSGAAQAYAASRGIGKIQISLTHARDYAAATAIASGESPPPLS